MPSIGQSFFLAVPTRYFIVSLNNVVRHTRLALGLKSIIASAFLASLPYDPHSTHAFDVGLRLCYVINPPPTYFPLLRLRPLYVHLDVPLVFFLQSQPTPPNAALLYISPHN